jgi:hypothetical protein
MLRKGAPVQPFVFISCCAGCEVGTRPGGQAPYRLRAITCICHVPGEYAAAFRHAVLLRLSVLSRVRKSFD